MRTRRQGNHLKTTQAAMQFLEVRLAAPTEAEWYAARIERLGRVIFGDLWDTPTVSPTRDAGTQDTGREP